MSDLEKCFWCNAEIPERPHKGFCCLDHLDQYEREQWRRERIKAEVPRMTVRCGLESETHDIQPYAFGQYRCADCGEFFPGPAKGSALQRQEGGGHYKDMKIQPIEFINANGFDFITGCIIKYAARHKSKNGAEDVRKIKHYCDLLLELEYNERG